MTRMIFPNQAQVWCTLMCMKNPHTGHHWFERIIWQLSLSQTSQCIAMHFHMPAMSQCRQCEQQQDMQKRMLQLNHQNISQHSWVIPKFQPFTFSGHSPAKPQPMLPVVEIIFAAPPAPQLRRSLMPRLINIFRHPWPVVEFSDMKIQYPTIVYFHSLKQQSSNIVISYVRPPCLVSPG